MNFIPERTQGNENQQMPIVGYQFKELMVRRHRIKYLVRREIVPTFYPSAAGSATSPEFIGELMDVDGHDHRRHSPNHSFLFL